MLKNNLENFYLDLQKRGIIAGWANYENFCQLRPGEKVIYLGIDCTAASLHIGHLFLLFQTIRFAREGFRVLLVLGGATSKIGDPSDKLKERPQLASEKLAEYQQKIKSQLERILMEPLKLTNLDFAPLETFYADNPQLLEKIHQILEIPAAGENSEKWAKYAEYIWPLRENKYQILDNQNWLNQLSFVDFIDQVGRNISINYLLAKETIKQRLESGLSYSAFSYSLLQAYDFYYLYKNYHCHGQLGGSDQWGNLTTGLKLIRGVYPNGKTFGVTFNMLVDKEGKKLSKSENKSGIIWLDENKTSRQEFYDFFRNMPDPQAEIFIRQFTFLSEEQIKELLKLNRPPRLRILQRILYELVFILNYRYYQKISI